MLMGDNFLEEELLNDELLDLVAVESESPSNASEEGVAGAAVAEESVKILKTNI